MPSLSVTPFDISIALLLATIGSFVQGSVGIGLAVIAAPILLLVNPAFVPGPLLLAAMVLVTLMAIRERRDINARHVAFATLGRTIGMLPALYAVMALPLPTYELLFASLILLGVLLSVSGWHIAATPGNVVVAAMLSGFAGTVSSVGGPAMALVYQNETGPRMRATISTIFTVGTLVSLAGLWAVGRFGFVELLLGAIMLPGVVVGFALSRFAVCRVDQTRVKPFVLALSTAAAVMILARLLAW